MPMYRQHSRDSRDKGRDSRDKGDRGAARSRKREEQAEKAALQAQAVKGDAGPSKSRRGKQHGSDKQTTPGAHHAKVQKKIKGPAEPQSRDPELYKPKAIRSSTALVWSLDAPSVIPPSKETLANLTRVDLGGSGVSDVEWLRGTGVRWLSLADCPVKDWTPVGTLNDLTVLNVSGCRLANLPECLKGLTHLKAIVAMNNPWKTISADILASMPELNSLIFSHSPNLVALPTLSTLVHLSKLTFSHCPRLTAASLPDLSSLPLLRDVKMNNLPLLTSIPPHLRTWGTGPMSLIKETDERHGAGLQVVDLGSCSLPLASLDTFTKKEWPNLRSITLHHNPLGTEDSKYASKLQESQRTLPKLQIIDTKRVVERKKKGEQAETKKERLKREKRARPSGTNNIRQKKTREWGAAAGEDGDEDDSGIEDGAIEFVDEDRQRLKAMDREQSEKKGKVPISSESSKHGKGDKKRKRDHDDNANVIKDKKIKSKPTATTDRPSVAKPKALPPLPTPSKPEAATVDPLDAVRKADPSALAPATKKRPSKTETSVVGVIDVVSGQSVDPLSGKGPKGKKDRRARGSRPATPAQSSSQPSAPSKGGVDLKALFAKKEQSSSGLGVGGW